MFFTSSNKKLFFFTSFCRLFDILRQIFLTSLVWFHCLLTLLKVLLKSICSVKQSKINRSVSKHGIKNSNGTNTKSNFRCPPFEFYAMSLVSFFKGLIYLVNRCSFLRLPALSFFKFVPQLY